MTRFYMNVFDDTGLVEKYSGPVQCVRVAEKKFAKAVKVKINDIEMTRISDAGLGSEMDAKGYPVGIYRFDGGTNIIGTLYARS